MQTSKCLRLAVEPSRRLGPTHCDPQGRLYGTELDLSPVPSTSRPRFAVSVPRDGALVGSPSLKQSAYRAILDERPASQSLSESAFSDFGSLQLVQVNNGARPMVVLRTGAASPTGAAYARMGP